MTVKDDKSIYRPFRDNNRSRNETKRTYARYDDEREAENKRSDAEMKEKSVVLCDTAKDVAQRSLEGKDITKAQEKFLKSPAGRVALRMEFAKRGVELPGFYADMIVDAYDEARNKDTKPDMRVKNRRIVLNEIGKLYQIEAMKPSEEGTAKMIINVIGDVIISDDGNTKPTCPIPIAETTDSGG